PGPRAHGAGAIQIMRNLLLLLLLANILYFVWEMATEEPPEQGVEILDRSDIGPPLSLADSRTAMAMRAQAALESAAPPVTLAAVIGNACASIGPFANSAE